jgi:hypothetical protein
MLGYAIPGLRMRLGAWGIIGCCAGQVRHLGQPVRYAVRVAKGALECFCLLVGEIASQKLYLPNSSTSIGQAGPRPRSRDRWCELRSHLNGYLPSPEGKNPECVPWTRGHQVPRFLPTSVLRLRRSPRSLQTCRGHLAGCPDSQVRLPTFRSILL